MTRLEPKKNSHRASSLRRRKDLAATDLGLQAGISSGSVVSRKFACYPPLRLKKSLIDICGIQTPASGQ